VRPVKKKAPCLEGSTFVVMHALLARRTLSICTVRRSTTCLGASFPLGIPARESPEWDKALARCSQLSTLSNWPVTTKWDRLALTIQSARPSKTFSRKVPPRGSTCHRQWLMAAHQFLWTGFKIPTKKTTTVQPARFRPAWWPEDGRNEAN